VISVSGLFVYPVKSCSGVMVDEAIVGTTGFELDRRWVVASEDGVFLSQRGHPRLALVKVRVGGNRLWLEAPNLPVIEVPLEREPGPTVKVTVWGDDCAALDEGKDAAEFFSLHLGSSARLVRLADDDVRPLSSSSAQPGDRISFADGFPFLLLSEASLEGLNRRLSLPVPMDRFRPNIVVSGCPAHAEDGWRQVRIGDVDFRVVKPCARCVITTTNQETGDRSAEPLRTLATYRVRESQVIFGQNLIHGGRGSMRVGDPVVVLSNKKHR
jgi:uncharacterized protein YcbX